MALADLDQWSYDELLGRYPKVVICFWATWSEPSLEFQLILDEVARDNLDIAFGQVEIGSEVELAQRLGVDSVPTLLGYRDGVRIFHRPGAPNPKRLEKLFDQLRVGTLEDRIWSELGVRDDGSPRRFFKGPLRRRR